MVTASVLKGVTTYLSSLNAKSAVYNDDLTLVWTNCEEFFKTLDTKVIRAALPIKAEQPISVVMDKVKYVMNVVPLYRSKRLVCGYACVLRDSYEIYRMISSSALADYNELFLKETQEKATRIIGASKVMEKLVPKDENGEKLLGLIKEQHVQAERIFTEASGNNAASALKDEDGELYVNCNVSALIAGLCTEASQCLVKARRRLIKNIDGRSYYAKIDYKTFAIAFMSTFRSHLYISPLKSDIEISSRFEEGDCFITVKSDMLPDDMIDFMQETKSQQDRELARRIIMSECDGSLTFTTEGGKAATELRVPVIKKNRGPMLNNSNSEYLAGGYRPVHPFFDEITEKEELAVAAEKEPKGGATRVIGQKRKKK